MVRLLISAGPRFVLGCRSRLFRRWARAPYYSAGTVEAAEGLLRVARGPVCYRFYGGVEIRKL